MTAITPIASETGIIITMPHPGFRRASFFAACVILAAATAPVRAGEPAGPQAWKVSGRTHVTAAWTDLDGPGSEIPGLAQTYDLSLYDTLLGSKHARHNGSGVTLTGSAASFPLVDGEALAQNTKIGLTGPLSEHLFAGADAEIYSVLGERAVGQVFGPEIPWGDFPRENGAIELPRFWADLYTVWLEGRADRSRFKLLGGTLPPAELPAFAQGERNQVGLASLVWRVPGTNESYYEKSEWKYVTGRHPVRGFDLTFSHEYAEGRKVEAECFTGSSEPTPISAIDRDAYGGRVAVDVGAGNVGFTSVFNEGVKSDIGIDETQWVWAVDASHPLGETLTPYAAVAWTDYEIGAPAQSQSDAAYVAGTVLRLPRGYKLKAQYQRLEENYDLMGYHKKEHYPGNSEGVSAWLSGPLGPAASFKVSVLHARQIDTETTTDDTLFGDGYFASDSGSGRGTIGAQRIEVDWRICSGATFRGIVEHASFRKESAAASRGVDKDVYNFYGSFLVPLTDRLSLRGGLRHFFSVGDWQGTPFRAYQDAPEAAIVYKLDPQRRASLIYHRIEYQDNTGQARGQNDYDGHQVLAEVRTTF